PPGSRGPFAHVHEGAAGVGDERLGLHREDGVRSAGRRPHEVVLQEGAVGEDPGGGRAVAERRYAADGVAGGLADDVGLGAGHLVRAEFPPDRFQVDAGGAVHQDQHGHPVGGEDQGLADLAEFAADGRGGLGGLAGGAGVVRRAQDLGDQRRAAAGGPGLGGAGVGGGGVGGGAVGGGGQAGPVGGRGGEGGTGVSHRRARRPEGEAGEGAP